MATTYHQLGITAQDRGRLDEADDWYRKSLAINEELGDRPGMAATYHQLGMTAQDRGRLDEAEDWYRKSLAINEELGDRPGMAATYHQLGMTAQDRGRLDEADDWYRNPSPSKRNSATGPGMALTYGQLGLLAEDRQQPRQALDVERPVRDPFNQFPSPRPGPGPRTWPGSPASSACPPWSKPGSRSPASPCRRRSATTSPATTTKNPEASHDRPGRRRGPLRRRHPRPRPRPHLPAEVEAALAARGTEQRPGRYLDPVSLASLIVAIATLAWTIYNDQRNRTPDPPPADSVARQVRITLREQDTALPAGTERITEVVATEIIRHSAPPR